MTLEQAQAWAIIIGAWSGLIVAGIVAWRQNGTVKKVGDIHDQTATTNGRTLGEIIEANDLSKPHDH